MDQWIHDQSFNQSKNTYPYLILFNLITFLNIYEYMYRFSQLVIIFT